MDLARCEGSHLHCVASGCGCPCHGRSLPPEQPPEPEVRVGVKASARAKTREKVTDLPVKQILAAFDAGKPPTTIAREVHVGYQRIQMLLLDHGRRISRRRPRNSLPAKTIREERQQGETISALARKFNCDRRTVHRILGNGPKRRIPPPGANK